LHTSFSPNALMLGALGPFPWSWDDHSLSPYRWLYPGTTLWILALPAAAYGLIASTRSRKPVLVSLAAYAAVYAVAYYLAFPSGFFRQRMLLEPLAFFFAGYAFSLRPRQLAVATSSWMFLIATAALAQSGAVRTRVLVPLILVAVAVARSRRWLSAAQASLTRRSTPHPRWAMLLRQPSDAGRRGAAP
jgi:hypothetical protein